MQAPPRLIFPSDTSFSAEWGRWAPELERALERDRYELGDVFARLAAGDAHLWVDPSAAVVTEIGVYPKRKVLRAWLAAGEYRGIRRIEAQVIPWARHFGCDAIEIIGRLGWRRRLTDYCERAVTMTKEI